MKSVVDVQANRDYMFLYFNYVCVYYWIVVCVLAWIISMQKKHLRKRCANQMIGRTIWPGLYADFCLCQFLVDYN